MPDAANMVSKNSIITAADSTARSSRTTDMIVATAFEYRPSFSMRNNRNAQSQGTGVGHISTRKNGEIAAKSIKAPPVKTYLIRPKIGFLNLGSSTQQYKRAKYSNRNTAVTIISSAWNFGLYRSRSHSMLSSVMSSTESMIIAKITKSTTPGMP